MRPVFADILSPKTLSVSQTPSSSSKVSLVKIFALVLSIGMALVCPSLTAFAQEGNALNQRSLTSSTYNLANTLQQRTLPINQSVLDLYQSPGDIRYQDTISLSEAYLGVIENRSDKAVYPQNGTGEEVVRIGAKSFMNLDSSQSVWGNAEFSTGSYKYVKWSNCIDYDRIAPYVLGDEVGGDLSFRQYLFGGGYSYLMDNGLTLGASLNYRAQIAWRDRDPRVRTIVSDLEFSLGASYRYNSCRFVGLAATIESYTQNCDLEFYNPLNEINTLPLTGMGSYNKRFAGNTNKNSGHSGIGYKLACHLGSSKIDHRGLELAIWFKGMRMNQMLRNFNNITFAYTDTYVTHATIAYPIILSYNFRIMPLVEGEYFHRLGTENIFGTASGASYDKIGSRSPYLNQHLNVSLSLPLEFNFGGNEVSKSSCPKTYLTVEPSAVYHKMKEELTSLAREFDFTTVSPEIALSLSRLSGNWLLDIRGMYGWTSCLDHKWAFPGFDPTSALQESVASTFGMLSSSVSTFGGDFSLSRKIGKMIFGVSVSYSHRNYNVSNTSLNQTGTNLSTSTSSKSSSSITSSSITSYLWDTTYGQKTKKHSDYLDISLKINF